MEQSINISKKNFTGSFTSSKAVLLGYIFDEEHCVYFFNDMSKPLLSEEGNLLSSDFILKFSWCILSAALEAD